MPDKAFVNPQWDKYAIVYYSGDWVSKTEFEGSTQATCYHTLEDAYDQSGLDTFYIYNAPDSPLSLVAPLGTYVQTNSCYITKNLYVHADTFQLEYSTYEKGLNIYGVTVDFSVSNSFKVVATKARLNVANGAYFQLGANEGVTSVFLDNCGTVYVESASFSAPSVTNSREISLNEASFSVASVTNTGDGTFKVKGNSSLTIGALSGTILTDSAAATTLNASNITGGSITVQNALNFTGANTLNGVTLNAAGNTVTVGTAEGDSLTLSGTSTLKDSNINGSSISAQGNLTFTGANTLNGVTLDAAGNTVTVGTDEGDSLTVGGTSTLTIGTLNGEIKTAANTTLQNSNISGGGTNGGAITAQGAITVNNSTITSCKFTATTAYGADFNGACILDSVKLDAGTWNSVNVSVDGTLTIKGETTLKIASVFAYNGTIYLDGATIKDSSIVGGQSGAYGGTLVVESGKTATFSTSSKAYSNDFGRTSISNSGTITVNGLMTCGTMDNTNGTIAINGGAKVKSTISGGNITTSDTGTVTVQYSTISSSAFTATADEVIFYDQNTLNSVTLNATAENTTVKANGTLTVGGTSTLNIRSLDGTIKTGSAGTTLNASSITGGGTNGGTITALGNLTFAGTNVLQDVTFNATAEEKTVTVDTSLWVQGTSTLNIGTLNGVIRTNVATTFSNSTISGGDGGLYIYENTDVTFAGENQINAAYWWTTPGHYSSIINNGLITVKSIPASGDNPNALDYVPAQRGVLKAVDIWNSGSITAGSADAENADACSIEVTNLTNNNSLTVTCNAELANPSRLKATQGIVNNGMMTLTNSELTANTLTNYGRGTFDPGPPRTSQAAITISDSIVSITDSLTNGAANNTSATIEFNNSTVTANSVTNYGIDNGTGGNTGRAGFIVNDSTFTANNTLTNHGWIYVNNSTLHATSLVNNNKFCVYGTSTLNIGTLTGRIDIINGNDTGSLLTLNNSHITGKVNGDGSLGSSIYVTNPLTFTGTNTLTNTQFYAPYANKTVTVDSGATLTVKGTSKLNIASLNGTILTDADDLTTLKDSSITGGGTNGGTITAQGDLTFTGANTLNSVTLNAANKTVTNTGTLTVGGTLSFNGNLNVAGNASLAVGNGAGITVTGNISNSGSITVTGTGSLSVANIINSYDNSNENDNGTITVDALSTLKAVTVSGGRVTVKRDSSQVLTEDVYHVVDAKLQEDVSVGFIGDLGDYAFCPSFNSGLYLFKKDPSTVYVNGNYPAQPNTLTPDGHLVGVNAFTNNPDGTETSLHFSNNTEKIVYYANENAYAALNLAVDNAPASLTITTEAVGNNEVVTMGPLTVGAGQTVTLSGAKMTLTDATEPAASSLSVSSGSTLNVGVESAASGLTAQTINNAGTINVTNSTFAASTVSTSAVDDGFFVAGESTLNIDSLNGKIKLNDGATVSNSTVYSDVNVEETTTSCSGRLVIATGSSVTFAGANTFRDSNNVKGVAIGNLGSVTVKSIAASGDNPAVAGALKVFGFDNVDTITVGSNSDACTFDVINLNNYHALTVNGKTDDLSRLKASLIKNYGTIELTKAIAEAGSLQNGNESNTTTTIGITNSEFTADSVTNYSSGANAREGMTVINSTLFKANSLVNSGTIKFRGKNKLDIGSLNGTLYFDNAEGTQATLNDSSITGGTLQAVSNLTFNGENTLTNITISAVSRDVTVGDSDPETVDSLTLTNSTLTASEVTTSNGGTLTVSGANNTLNIGTLNGEIKTAASTTLQNSNITGGSITALGSVTVKNSTISSNVFTAKVYEVDFSGACILDGVNLDMEMYNVPDDCRVFVSNGDTLTISSGTLSTGKLYGYGTVTVKGENELHIRELYGDGIKLDDATIKDSSIVGGMSGNFGGTLLVESGKTATFSTTGSNRNNLANTSIINSGTSDTSYGTITVNGKMTCGTVTNNAYAKIFISDADFTAGTVTNLAEGLDSTGAQITVTDSSFTATTVSAAFHSKFNVEGASSLNITNLTGTIDLKNGATISNSTVYGDINKENWNYLGMLKTSSSAIFAGSNIFLNDTRDRGLSLEINGSATVKSTSNQQGVLKASYINQLGNLTVGSETDACSLDANELRNLGTVTVQGNKNDQKRSKLSAIKVENDDTDTWMTLNYIELTATTLENDGYGTTPQAAMTIGDSIVNITGSLTNGFSTDTHTNDKATIEFNNHSTVTAESVTNYGTHNGTGGNTGRAGFIVNDSTFTANNTLTNHGWIYVNNSTLHATSLVNNNKFCVYGTSTLNIGTLTGRIDIINGNDTGSLLTLNNSHITGKVNGDGSLGSSIYVTNPLTFTGTNTLTNTQFYAPYANKTVTVDSGATLTVKGTSKLNIASLNGTILTDADDLTTLTASSITNGTISAQNSLAFTGANTLNSVTLSAAGQAVTVDSGATLTVGGTSTLNIGTLGGTITVANGATLSNSTIGGTGTVKVQSGAPLTLDGVNAITTFDLSEATGVVMDWQDQLSFTGFGSSYANKLTINLDNFTAGDLSTPILHYTGEWTKAEAEAMYRALLNNETTPWASSESDPIQYSFYVDENCDLCISISQIVVDGGEYDTITVLNGIDSIIEDGEFQRGVMAGNFVTEADAVNVGDISMTVNGGTYEKLVGGGDCVNPAESGETTSAIRCAEFTGAGSEITYAKTTINFAITDGVFKQNVVGGMEYMDTTVEKLGYSKLYGDIKLNVSGGEFQRYLYGGSVAANKSLSGCTEIVGDVVITIDATDPGSGTKTIKVNKVACGSYNVGTITGSTKLVLKGKANNLQFFEGGEIWGGCGGDYYKTGTPGEREFQSNITGSRTLSFTGFNGALDANCTKIRGFSVIEFLENSVVTLARTDYNLSDVEKWEFEYDAENSTGSSLSGSFTNNFTNDTLTMNLNGLDLSGLSAEAQAAWKWTVLENDSTAADAFKGFGGTGDDILQVSLNDGAVSMAWNGSCYTGGGYNFSLEDNNKLVLTLA